MSTVLRLFGLGERHPGVTNALGEAYAEAASVCLSQHHQKPDRGCRTLQEKRIELRLALD